MQYVAAKPMTGPQGNLLPAGSIVDVGGWTNVHRQVRTGHLVAVEDGMADALLTPMLAGEYPAAEVLAKSSLTRITAAKLLRQLRPVGSRGPNLVAVSREEVSADMVDTCGQDDGLNLASPEASPAPMPEPVFAGQAEAAKPAPLPQSKPKKWGRKR